MTMTRRMSIPMTASNKQTRINDNNNSKEQTIKMTTPTSMPISIPIPVFAE